MAGDMHDAAAISRAGARRTTAYIGGHRRTRLARYRLPGPSVIEARDFKPFTPSVTFAAEGRGAAQ